MKFLNRTALATPGDLTRATPGQPLAAMIAILLPTMLASCATTTTAPTISRNPEGMSAGQAGAAGSEISMEAGGESSPATG
ncbi:MAG: hypothetical protein KAY03_00695, partial [Arenimonas sp.]|nr:hypothetical protein [Arenimonas sp.]